MRAGVSMCARTHTRTERDSGRERSSCSRVHSPYCRSGLRSAAVKQEPGAPTESPASLAAAQVLGSSLAAFPSASAVSSQDLSWHTNERRCWHCPPCLNNLCATMPAHSTPSMVSNIICVCGWGHGQQHSEFSHMAYSSPNPNGDQGYAGLMAGAKST